MTNQPVIRDERTVAVENASYRLAYVVLTFGLFVIVAVRALVLKQTHWDVFALVIVSSGVATFRQWRQRILTRGWVQMGLVIALAGAVVGGAIVVFVLKTHWGR